LATGSREAKKALKDEKTRRKFGKTSKIFRENFFSFCMKKERESLIILNGYFLY